MLKGKLTKLSAAIFAALMTPGLIESVVSAVSDFFTSSQGGGFAIAIAAGKLIAALGVIFGGVRAAADYGQNGFGGYVITKVGQKKADSPFAPYLDEID